MIGKVYLSIVPYYDVKTKRQSFKSRPCLVIGQADSSDYVVLPISTISDKRKVDLYYDVLLDSSVFTFLTKNSYLRTHKQTVVNIASLKGPIADFKLMHDDTYLDSLARVEKFQNEMIINAI